MLLRAKARSSLALSRPRTDPVNATSNALVAVATSSGTITHADPAIRSVDSYVSQHELEEPPTDGSVTPEYYDADDFNTSSPHVHIEPTPDDFRPLTASEAAALPDYHDGPGASPRTFNDASNNIFCSAADLQNDSRFQPRHANCDGTPPGSPSITPAPSSQSICTDPPPDASSDAPERPLHLRVPKTFQITENPAQFDHDSRTLDDGSAEPSFVFSRIANNLGIDGKALIQATVNNMVSDPSSPVGAVINNTIEQIISKDIKRQSRSARRVVVQDCLSQAEQQELHSCFPGLSLQVKSTQTGPHAFARAHRLCSLVYLLNQCRYYEQRKTRSSGRFLVKDVGANYSRHVLEGNYDIHMCCPVIDMRDAQRHSDSYNICSANIKNPNKNISTLATLTLESTVRHYNGQSRIEDHPLCHQRAQHCTTKATYLTFLHSTYDMRLMDMAAAMDSADAINGFGVIIFHPMVLHKTEGTIPTIDCHFQKILVGKRMTIRFWFNNDPQLGYEHDFETYVQLITRTAVTTAHNSYHIQISNISHGHLFFTLTRNVHPIAIDSPTQSFRRIEEIVGDNMVAVEYYTWVTDVFQRTSDFALGLDNMRRRTIVVSRQLYEHVAGYLASVKPVNFTIETALSAVTSYNTRVVVNGVQVVATNKATTEDALELAHAIYFHIYVKKYRASQVLSKLIKDEQDARVNGGRFSFWNLFTRSVRRGVRKYDPSEEMSQNGLLQELLAEHSIDRSDVKAKTLFQRIIEYGTFQRRYTTCVHDPVRFSSFNYPAEALKGNFSVLTRFLFYGETQDAVDTPRPPPPTLLDSRDDAVEHPTCLNSDLLHLSDVDGRDGCCSTRAFAVSLGVTDVEKFVHDNPDTTGLHVGNLRHFTNLARRYNVALCIHDFDRRTDNKFVHVNPANSPEIIHVVIHAGHAYGARLYRSSCKLRLDAEPDRVKETIDGIPTETVSRLKKRFEIFDGLNPIETAALAIAQISEHFGARTFAVISRNPSEIVLWKTIIATAGLAQPANLSSDTSADMIFADVGGLTDDQTKALLRPGLLPRSDHLLVRFPNTKKLLTVLQIFPDRIFTPVRPFSVPALSSEFYLVVSIDNWTRVPCDPVEIERNIVGKLNAVRNREADVIQSCYTSGTDLVMTTGASFVRMSSSERFLRWDPWAHIDRSKAHSFDNLAPRKPTVTSPQPSALKVTESTVASSSTPSLSTREPLDTESGRTLQPDSPDTLVGASVNTTSTVPSVVFDGDQPCSSTTGPIDKIAISRAMSHFLRHNLHSHPHLLRDGGYVPLDDLVRILTRTQPRITAALVREIVSADTKQRYAITSDKSGIELIRANQGHTVTDTKLDSIFAKLSETELPPYATHGTTDDAWSTIRTQGLSRMKRNHIHLVPGVVGPDHPTLPGLRTASRVLVYVDVLGAAGAGITFLLSPNGVLLTPGNSDGIIPPQFLTDKRPDVGSTESLDLGTPRSRSSLSTDSVETDDSSREDPTREGFASSVQDCIAYMRRRVETCENQIIEYWREYADRFETDPRGTANAVAAGAENIAFVRGRVDGQPHFLNKPRVVRPEYSHFYDGKSFEPLSKLRDGVLGVVSDYTQAYIDKNTIYALRTATPRPLHDVDIEFIVGVPGCGKTTALTSKYEYDNTTAYITTTKAGRNEAAARLTRKWAQTQNPPRNGPSDAVAMNIRHCVRTYASALLRDLQTTVTTLLLDEAMMQHPGIIGALLFRNSGVTRVMIVGDPQQIQFICRVNGYDTKFHSVADVLQPTRVMSISYRCPPDVAAAWYQLYSDNYTHLGGDFTSSHPFRNHTMRKVIISGVHGVVPGGDETQYLAFTQHEKSEMIGAGFRNTLTVNEFQGEQQKHVVLVRLRNKETDEIYRKTDQALVATTRHTRTFVYYTAYSGVDAVTQAIARSNTIPPRTTRDTHCGGDLFPLRPYRTNYVAGLPAVKSGRTAYGTPIIVPNRKLRSVHQLIPPDTGACILRMPHKGPDALDNAARLRSVARKLGVRLVTDTTHRAYDPVLIESIDSIITNNSAIADPLDVVRWKRADLERNPPPPVEMSLPSPSIQRLQVIHDNIFPQTILAIDGLMNYQSNHSDLDLNVRDITINPAGRLYQHPKFDYAQPALRTRAPILRPNTWREALHSAFKRNMSVADGFGHTDEVGVAREAFELFTRNFLLNDDDSNRVRSTPITVNANLIREWFDDQDNLDAAAIATDVGIHQHALNSFQFALKTTPKPDLTDSAAFTHPALQTIVFSRKTINAIFCPVFREVKRRLLQIAAPNLIFFADMSPSDLADRLSEVDSLGSMWTDTTEIDISKYDKSQALSALHIDCHLMRYFGVHEDLVRLWYESHVYSSARDFANKMTVYTAFQRKSGDASTLLGNTVFLLCVISLLVDRGNAAARLATGVDCVDLRSCLTLASGDDSYIFGCRGIRRANQVATDVFNLETKMIFKTSKYFCSKFLVRVDGRAYVLPDPLKLLVKLGRADMFCPEHVEEFRRSLLDLTKHYAVAGVHHQLDAAVSDRYGHHADANGLSLALRAVIDDRDTFHQLYVFHPDMNLNPNRWNND